MRKLKILSILVMTTGESDGQRFFHVKNTQSLLRDWHSISKLQMEQLYPGCVVFFYFNACANWNWLYSTNREIACQSILYDKLNRLACGNVPTAISNDKPFWSRLRNQAWLLLLHFFLQSLRPKLAKRRRPLTLRVTCPRLRTWRRRWRGSVRNTSTSWPSPTLLWWT